MVGEDDDELPAVSRTAKLAHRHAVLFVVVD